MIEHNLDVINNCDWVIDFRPEGERKVGEILLDLKSAKNLYVADVIRKIQKVVYKLIEYLLWLVSSKAIFFRFFDR